jgi:hypothetical protein
MVAWARDQIARGADSLSVLHQRMAQWARDPSVPSTDLERLQREITRATAKQAQCITELQLDEGTKELALPAPVRAEATRRPVRLAVLDTLHLIGVPATPRDLSLIAAACLDAHVPVSRFASLRRDDEKAWRANPAARPEYVVPAISASELTAMPRIVATSAFPLAERLIGIRTPRRNALRALLALIDVWERARTTTGDGQRAILHIIASYGRMLPGVAGALDEETAPRLWRDAAQAELAAIEPADRDERVTAATTMAAWDTRTQLWGREGLRAIQVREP